MHLNATGRRISRRDPKDPVRVEAGKRAVASDIHHFKQGQVRSNHLGYDCYRTGSINGVAKIRLVLRAGQIPPHLPVDARMLLPTEMWWPQPDHRAAHALVDAIITFDLPTLQAWKEQWPEHEFGFEQFRIDAERRVAAVRQGAIAAAPERATPLRLDGTGPTSIAGTRAALPKQLALFPGQVVKIEPQGGYRTDTYIVRTALVRFDDGQAALRVDVGGFFTDGEKMLCSRAYVDLLDGRFEIVENYPGRLRAFNLPATLIYQVLGLRAPLPPRRTVRSPAPADRTRGVDETIREGAKIQAVLLAGDVSAEAEPRKRVDAEPVPGTKRYEDALAADLDDPQTFPEAPGPRKSGG